MLTAQQPEDQCNIITSKRINKTNMYIQTKTKLANTYHLDNSDLTGATLRATMQ
jgi:hypothetical protein